MLIDAGVADENELSYFDAQTGEVHPILRFQAPFASYGAEFSPNSNYLYLSGWTSSTEKILQYDLSNLEPTVFTQSFKHIADFEGGALQMGIDGKYMLQGKKQDGWELSMIHQIEIHHVITNKMAYFLEAK
ncbi:MAG: hypothetical protein IPH45_10100 [Bacteroidales bacterium]|nr:hypothetical protein [Bacteroidales bacterium]